MNNEYEYVVDYVREGKRARADLRALIHRSLEAYAGRPSHNAYADRFFNTGTNQSIPQETRQRINARCTEVPRGYDDTIFNAIETVTSMVMGSPEQYKFDLYDKYQLIDDDFVDRMAAYADFVYHSNHIDGLMAPTARDICLKANPFWHLRWEDDMLKVTLLDAAKVFYDPHKSRTNRIRYRGFGNWESFSDLKKKITKHGNQYSIKMLNDIDVYLSELRAAYVGETYNESLTDVLAEDLGSIYGIPIDLPRGSGTSLGDLDKEPTDIHQYIGRDVWVDYIWVYDEHTQYTVVNERYVLEKKVHPLRNTFDVVTYSTELDSKTHEFKQKKHTHTRTVELDDPLVEFSWINDDNSPFPTSPVWLQLNTFDDLCAAKSLFTHNVSIAGPITLTGTSYDAEIAASLMGLSGEFLEGLSSQIGVLNKTFDSSMLLTYINNLQESIKKSLGAVDQYQLQSMIGNRATAEEVGSVSGVASQRMNSLIASIESSMAEFFYKAFQMQLIFGFKSGDGKSKRPVVSFPYKGSYGELTREQLSTQFNLQVKMSSSIKTEQIAMGKNAIQILGYAMNNEYVDQAQLFALLIPMILRGQVSAAQARSLIKKDYTNDLNVANMINQARQRENARKAMGLSPITFSDVQNMTTGDIDSIINYAAGAPAASNSVATEDSGSINPIGNNAYNQAAKQLAASGANISSAQLAEMMRGAKSSGQNATNQQRATAASIQNGSQQMPDGTTNGLAGELQNQL